MKNRKRFVSIMAGVLAAIMLLSLIVGLLPSRAHALSSSEIRDQINALEEKQDAIQAQMDELDEQIQSTVGKMENIVAEKNIIDQQVFLLNQQVQNINDQISAYSVLIADKQDELDEAEHRYQDLSEHNKERIRAMEEDGQLSYWSVLFKSNSFSDLLDRLNMIDEIARSDKRRMQELTQAADELKEIRESLMAEKANLEESRQELATAQEALAEKRAEADALLVKLNDAGEEYLSQRAEALAKFDELVEEIGAKEAEYDKAVDAEYWATYVEPPFPPGTSSGGGNDSGAYWAPPLTTGLYVVSPYGYRLHPIYGIWRLHAGVDLDANSGDPILASRGGVVTTATYEAGGAGYYVVINHGDGYSSAYMHMTNYIVGVGDYITQGQVIGYVGSTGAATGPHLHFTIYRNGSTVNPMDYL